MDRRFWIKNIMVVGGGLVFLPSCLNNETKASIHLKNIVVNGNEEMLLADVVETIIPATDTLGAKDLDVHHFVLKMIDDCYMQEDQAKYIKGLKELNAYLKKTTGKYLGTDADKRPAIFSDLTSGTASEKDVQYFLETTKQLTMLGYTQSKYVMTKLIPYELVPGRFHGCVKINKAV